MRAYQYEVEFKDKGSHNARLLARNMDGLDRSTDRLDKSMHMAGRSSAKFSKEMREMRSPISGATRMLGGLRSAAVGVIGVSALLSSGVALSNAGNEFEQTRISFETMTGSIEQGNKSIAELKQFANVTPFNNNEVFKASKSLLAYNVEAKDLIPTLTDLGNIASGVGRDKLPNLILAFGQVKAAGRLTGMELRQFTEAGVPLLDELAKQTGKSVAAIKEELIPAGKVGFEQVKLALRGMSQEGGRFFNLMERQSRTFGGRMSTLQGKIGLVAEGIGTSLNSALTPALEGAISATDTLIEMMEPASDQFLKKRDSVRALAKETKPLVARYEELTGKAKLNKEEQIELKTVTQQLAELMPTAVTAWNKYGEAISINTGLLDENIKKSKAFIERERGDVLSDLKSDAEKELLIVQRNQAKLNSGTTLVSNAGSASFSARALSKQEITNLKSDIEAVMGVKSENTGGSLIDIINESRKIRQQRPVTTKEFFNYQGNILELLDKKLQPLEEKEETIASADAGGMSTATTDDPDLEAGMESITAGGSKNVTINMSGLKFAENIEINPENLDQGIEELEPQMREWFVRLLNSGLQTTTQF